MGPTRTGWDTMRSSGGGRGGSGSRRRGSRSTITRTTRLPRWGGCFVRSSRTMAVRTLSSNPLPSTLLSMSTCLLRTSAPAPRRPTEAPGCTIRRCQAAGRWCPSGSGGSSSTAPSSTRTSSTCGGRIFLGSTPCFTSTPTPPGQPSVACLCSGTKRHSPRRRRSLSISTTPGWRRQRGSASRVGPRLWSCLHGTTPSHLTSPWRP
mmetsp:Transcript_9455/g.24393  ORF Transcript_9455/g.24393 Transcript_9455/m.24393 type:complete len:206 (+) Transcript_9455:295-912(+)